MKAIRPFADADNAAPYAVRYAPYDAALPEVFDELERLVRDAAGPVRLEHVGSTSVPGLGGRNALDVAMPTAGDAQPAVQRALYGLGFQDSPFPHYLPLLVGRLELRESSYPVLLYLVAPGSDVLRDWLAFRDHLRVHVEDAITYDAIKRRIALGGIEGEAYQAAKEPFLTSLVAKIRTAGDV